MSVVVGERAHLERVSSDFGGVRGSTVRLDGLVITPTQNIRKVQWI